MSREASWCSLQVSDSSVGLEKTRSAAFLPYTDVGNNYGIGEERKRELRGSCEALAIDKGRCAVLDHPDIQDNPTVWWKEELIESIARDYIRKWNIDAVS
jgi:LmbE family N-acetylglucosaminyl deacetylase